MLQDKTKQCHEQALTTFLKKYRNKLSTSDFEAINTIVSRLASNGIDIKNVHSIRELLALAQKNIGSLNKTQAQSPKTLKVGDIFSAKQKLLLKPINYVCYNLPNPSEIICGINQDDVTKIWRWIVDEVLTNEQKKEFDDLVTQSQNKEEERDNINIIQKCIASSLEKYCQEDVGESKNNYITKRFGSVEFIDYIRILHDCLVNSNAIEFIYLRFAILKKKHKNLNTFLCLDCFKICEDLLEGYAYLGITLLYNFFPDPTTIIETACKYKRVQDSVALDRTDYAICLRAAFFQASLLQQDLIASLKNEKYTLYDIKQNLQFFYHYIYSLSSKLPKGREGPYKAHILTIRESFSQMFDDALEELNVSLPHILNESGADKEEDHDTIETNLRYFTIIRESRLFADQLLVNLKLQQGYDRCRDIIETKKNDILLQLRSGKYPTRELKRSAKNIERFLSVFLNDQNVEDFSYEVEIISKRIQRQASFG